MLYESSVFVFVIEMKELLLGTFCSGTDSPVFALRQKNIPFKHLFSSEVDSNAIKFISQNTSVEKMYGDITKLKYKRLPYVDLFIAGPPCQIFSTLNNDRLCSDDSRLDVLVSCLKYIKAKKPKFAIIENVVPIQKLWSQSFGEIPKSDDNFSEIWNSKVNPILKSILKHYSYKHSVLSPTHFNCPQERRRCYVVFFTGSFEFPAQKLTSLTYRDVIDPSDKSMSSYPIIPYHEKIIKEALEKYGKSWNGGVNNINTLSKQVHEEKKTARPTSMYCRCLISDNKTIVFELHRYLTIKELLKFQGFSPKKVKVSGLSYNKINKLMGNAMNVKILEALFKQIVLMNPDI